MLKRRTRDQDLQVWAIAPPLQWLLTPLIAFIASGRWTQCLDLCTNLKSMGHIPTWVPVAVVVFQWLPVATDRIALLSQNVDGGLKSALDTENTMAFQCRSKSHPRKHQMLILLLSSFLKTSTVSNFKVGEARFL